MILNYTTKVKAEKTASEIQKILAKHGARSVLTEYDADGALEAISFQYEYRGQVVAFVLPARIDAVFGILTDQRINATDRQKRREQAVRTAWRIIKDWLQAQFALIEAEQADLMQVFLPYVQDPRTGLTLYQRVENEGPKLLGYERHEG